MRNIFEIQPIQTTLSVNITVFKQNSYKNKNTHFIMISIKINNKMISLKINNKMISIKINNNMKTKVTILEIKTETIQIIQIIDNLKILKLTIIHNGSIIKTKI